MTLIYKRNAISWTILFVLAASCLWVAEGVGSTRETVAGFDYLLELSRSESTTMDTNRIHGILDYVDRTNQEAEPVCEGGLCQAPMAYYGTDVNVGLDKVLKYCFNPEIPSCAVVPSLIRLSSWRPVNGSTAPLPDLWTRLDDLAGPVVTHGDYYMQSTPDPSSGAYYGYDSSRTLILMTYKGRKTLISVLKQKDVSDVGKKGYVLEDNDAPDYFYSGEQGLNKLGLGWVKSYLYDSFSVAVYMEQPHGGHGIRYGVFKWIRAGWAGKNMVRHKHVQDGLIRFAQAFKTAMESDALPSLDALTRLCRLYKQIPQDELKLKVIDYLAGLRGKCSGDCPKILRKGFDPDSYIDQMNPMEMRATLIVDAIRHLKAKEGKPGNVAYRPGPEKTTVF